MRFADGSAASIRIGVRIAVALAAVVFACVGAFATEKSVHTGIMPLDRGITFGRTLIGGDPHILAILSEDGDRVRAVDLSAQLGHYPNQPLDLFADNTASEMRGLIEAAAEEGRTIEIQKSALIAPVATKGRHVATAVNYPKHAVEAGEAPRQPFLFPKFAPARTGAARVANTPGGLLDYEIELGVVFDRPIASVDDLGDAVVGFVLVTDMTDRDALIRALFPGSANSEKGVAALTGAKSGPDRMQMATYLVVPFDRTDFEKTVEIQLAVNGDERQRETAGAMAEGVGVLVARALRADFRPQILLPGRANQATAAGRPGSGHGAAHRHAVGHRLPRSAALRQREKSVGRRHPKTDCCLGGRAARHRHLSKARRHHNRGGHPSGRNADRGCPDLC